MNRRLANSSTEILPEFSFAERWGRCIGLHRDVFDLQAWCLWCRGILDFAILTEPSVGCYLYSQNIQYILPKGEYWVIPTHIHPCLWGFQNALPPMPSELQNCWPLLPSGFPVFFFLIQPSRIHCFQGKRFCTFTSSQKFLLKDFSHTTFYEASNLHRLSDPCHHLHSWLNLWQLRLPLFQSQFSNHLNSIN